MHNFNHIAPHRAILPALFSVEASAPLRILVRSRRMLVRSPVISLNRMTHGAVPHISQCLALTTFAVAALLAGHYTSFSK